MHQTTVGESDWDLVARARAGEAEAFAALVRRYQNPITQFCRRMIGSPLDAEELAQEAFVRVYRHLGRIAPQAKFSTLLFGIARNLAVNHIRDSGRKGRSAGLPLEEAGAIRDEAHRPDRAARLREIETMIDRALAELSPEHREVLVLREFQGLDYDAIAQTTGCSKGTIKSRLARAREQLRVRLMEHGGELV